MNNSVTITWNPIASILSVIGTIGLWKILEDRGEKGWKALIPFYATYTLGKTFGGQKTALKMIASCILMILAFAGCALYTMANYSAGTDMIITDITDINGIDFVNSNISFTGNPMIVLLLLAIAIVALVVTIVYIIKFFRAFDKANNGPSWMILVWLFLNPLGYIYYAFTHKNDDIADVLDKISENIH